MKRQRWDPDLYGPPKDCWRCGKPIEPDGEVYFSGPGGEPAHAECEWEAWGAAEETPDEGTPR